MATELEELKLKAKDLGISFSPNIGAEALRKKIEAVEINNKTLQFHLTNGTVKSITGKLSDYEEALLCREEFIKVHRSYIINMSLMKSFSNHSFVSLSDVTIPISRNLQKQVKETYMSFLRAVIKQLTESQPLTETFYQHF